MKTFYIILAFCAGLFLGHLLFPTEKERQPPVIEAVEGTKDKLNVIDSTMFEGRIKFLQQNDSLKRSIEISNGLLSIRTSLLQTERKKVKRLSDRISQFLAQTQDSLLMDSLTSGIAELNAKTDSLVGCYERRDSLMQSMIAIRDTQIVLFDRTYQQTKDLLLEQSMREQQLTGNLNVALKQLKRKRLQNRILAGGMLFVSGIVTTLYIKSRQ